jgi:hypothetical protein
MSAEALRVQQVRRARVAIFGPGITGLIGVVLAGVGAIGFAITHDTATVRVDSPSAVSGNGAPGLAGGSAAISTHGRFLLVGADSRLYPLGDLAHPLISSAGAVSSSRSEPIIGAAPAAAGGVWLATSDGHVYASNVPAPGGVTLTTHAARIVGIASAVGGRGYRLVAADGHVYAVGAPSRGEYSLTNHTARVVGIATSAGDGYWIALSDGTVSPFGAPALGRLNLDAQASPVVGVASALDGSGYWLATADGHVHAYGVPFRGDLSTGRARVHVVAIAASAQGGYWLTTADGKVFPFAAPMFGGGVAQKPRAPIVAIVPF